ncbi:MAG TPA: exodeoxyribonuclease III [Acidimicrobiales bacterium]|nr:exodeoxyribonuclease III [Acidimicrobiales bacterium]
MEGSWREPGTLRVATWNVNSLRARMPRVEEWLSYANPDIVCLQETKVTDAAFPALAFQALGYDSAHHGGAGRWNGVGILSRVGMEDVMPGFAEEDPDAEARALAATCGGVRVLSVYVPNGRSVGSEHYEAKLEWLDRLERHLTSSCKPDEPMVLCGDFNIAPEDRDVYDPAAFVGATHVSEEERKALARIQDWGLVDAFRRCRPEDGLFTWWDYRAGDFHQHRGMRIDLVLATRELAEQATFALVDRNARKGKQPSDHAPVLVDFLCGDGAGR